MNEKLVAGIVAAAGIAPLCAVCVLGPAVVGSALTGAFAWLGGAGPVLMVALMAAVGGLIHRSARRRRALRAGDRARARYRDEEMEVTG